METKFVLLLFYSDSHRKYHQRRPKMHVLIVFWLDSISKHRCSSRSRPWKYQSQICGGSHDIKKQLFYCLAEQIPSPKIRVGTLRTMLYKFNTEIGRHLAMPFIVMHFKERNLQRWFWLFTSLSNSYDKSFSQKKMFGKVLWIGLWYLFLPFSVLSHI